MKLSLNIYNQHYTINMDHCIDDTIGLKIKPLHKRQTYNVTHQLVTLDQVL